MSHKTWGGRFTKPLNKKVLSFQASLSFDHMLYPYTILASQAHANMLAKQGLISSDEAIMIVQALSEIEDEIASGKVVWDLNAEDIYMFIEQCLIEKIGDVGKKLHTGRSRNDQTTLDLRLYLRDHAQIILKKLTTLCKICKKLSMRHMHIVMPGYTHLQQAQPILLGQYFDAYLAMFNRDMSRLQDWLKRMNQSPAGAGALAGSTLPIDRQWMAKKLCFDGVIDNTLDAVSDRDYVIEFCAVASLIMMHLARLSEDLIIWATQEFGFITLDDAFATGSSMMPNKKNPDVLELVRGKSARVFGHLIAALTLLKALPLTYNKDMQEDKELIFDTVDTLESVLGIVPAFLASIHFNEDVMKKSAQSGFLEATIILESLVLQGIPFRDAHHQVGLWVSEAIKRGCTLKTISEEKIAHLALPKKTILEQ